MIALWWCAAAGAGGCQNATAPAPRDGWAPVRGRGTWKGGDLLHGWHGLVRWAVCVCGGWAV